MILKKYHLQLTLPNSFIWKGFINVEAENIEDFPKIPEGEFSIMKDAEGWHGTFTLTNAGKCNVKYNWVISYCYRYVDNASIPAFYNTQDATDWMHKYDNKIGDESVRVPIIKGKLEECLQYDEYTNEPVVEIWKDNVFVKFIEETI